MRKTFLAMACLFTFACNAARADVLAQISVARQQMTVYVDGVRAPRQAGSTLKPFLYEMAIGRKLITAASLMWPGNCGAPGS